MTQDTPATDTRRQIQPTSPKPADLEIAGDETDLKSATGRPGTLPAPANPGRRPLFGV